MKRWVWIGAVCVAFAFVGWTVIAYLRVRQKAGRAQCADNLKQIGLGLLQYLDTFDTFPTGTVPNPSLPPERRLNWVVAAWGFVGDGQIRLIIDRDKPCDEPVNLRPTGYSPVDGPGATTEVFYSGCPGNDQTYSPGFSRVLQYVGVAGLGVDAASLPTSHPRAGVFGYDRVTRPADIKDGMFATMMVIETASRNRPWTAGGPASVRGLDPSRKPYIGKGRQFGGTHGGGVNVLFADGSVRFRKDTTHPRILEANSTIAGDTAEANPDDSF